jgi:hypothetical protein
MSDETAQNAVELPPAIRAAIDQLMAAVEAEARDVLRASQAHAAELERGAAETTSQIEEEAERSAERILRAALERASVVLDSIGVIENGLSGLATGLRTETGNLTSLLRTEAQNRQPELITGTGEEARADQPAPPGSDEGATELGNPGTTDEPELRKLVRATLYQMREDGRDRAHGEEVLNRFRVSHVYSDLLDEVYGPPPPPAEEAPPAPPRRRRGLLRRR